MFHDITNLVREKIVQQKVKEQYSVLTCRCCNTKEEFMGFVFIESLPGGWGTLNINGNSSKVFEWLLCPVCIKRVLTSAGL